MNINSTYSEQSKNDYTLKNAKFLDSKLSQKNQAVEIDEEFYQKKEKRNRKFFLKRSISLLQICKQSGKIELQIGSDFLHIEIMQGGHYPHNQYNFKDIRSEVYLDDTEFQSSNITCSLENASKCIVKKCRNLQSEQNCKSFTQIQQQFKEVNSFCKNIQKQDNTKNCQLDSQLLDSIFIKQNNQIDQQIQETKQILIEQHLAIIKSLQS
ncbi:unnamed protein product (macronuclear) [Paramecium tetraurelia]|uniref:Uncharacterized protein n=1 Tax=Paramecium tetraurelia TaxID=5888 RepID=A0DQQ5_PARTE|nr:uncharacterized protein GSPATT00002772001 [Paramecium tetraurelia]CAK85372.1 unnamed protein product [Paramecium tetraurelia]|eukprot:XP_001452769.1 hypothetical protein (macronuclear) [Paramecium tetraurelia strain d4-2]